MSVVTAILAMGVAAGYFAIAALVIPRITLEEATPRFVTAFRVGGVAFFVGCGLTHSHISYHALADDAEVGAHEAAFHLLQIFGVWMFLYAALRYLDVRVARRKSPHEVEAEQLARRVDELSRSNADLEQFAHVVAHDLKSPLHTVGGLARQLDGGRPDVAERLVAGIDRMDHLLDGVLAYSTAAGRRLERAPVDLDAVAREVEQALAAEIEERGAVITTSALPRVVGDSVQLRQLLQNLVGNALKFGDAATPHIEVSAKAGGGYCEVAVRDNGSGIPVADAERIFLMFERAHNGDDVPGTGLGLALCQKIVERHGGRIWVELADGGGGSVFRFTLPLDAPVAKPVA